MRRRNGGVQSSLPSATSASETPTSGQIGRAHRARASSSAAAAGVRGLTNPPRSRVSSRLSLVIPPEIPSKILRRRRPRHRRRHRPSRRTVRCQPCCAFGATSSSRSASSSNPLDRRSTIYSQACTRPTQRLRLESSWLGTQSASTRTLAQRRAPAAAAVRTRVAGRRRGCIGSLVRQRAQARQVLASRARAIARPLRPMRRRARRQNAAERRRRLQLLRTATHQQ